MSGHDRNVVLDLGVWVVLAGAIVLLGAIVSAAKAAPVASVMPSASVARVSCVFMKFLFRVCGWMERARLAGTCFELPRNIMACGSSLEGCDNCAAMWFLNQDRGRQTGLSR